MASKFFIFRDRQGVFCRCLPQPLFMLGLAAWPLYAGYLIIAAMHHEMVRLIAGFYTGDVMYGGFSMQAKSNYTREGDPKEELCCVASHLRPQKI